ncbi:protein ABHD13 [Hetaerina americana]|uniref:protein ABHD13 n=1 Tax=Hetaerina americana TaxID=62018 RepID=UPI003A7F45DC
MTIRLSASCTKLIKFIAAALMKCWALSSAAVFACFFLYWVYGGFLAFLLLCFAITGILYHTEDQLLFHPDQPSHSRVFVPVPTMFGLPYENIYIRSLDGVMLHLFFIRQSGELVSQVPTVLFLHGNAGNMGHRLQNVAGLYQQVRCNILMLEYRGYGLSQGAPSEDGLNMDARAALNYLLSRNDINCSEIIVFGRSLGGAVAIDLASHPEYASKIWCLILENTFTSIPDMAAVLLGWKVLNYLPLCCYKNKFLSQTKIQKLGVSSVLFVSGLADTLVPPRMMCDLHSLCPPLATQKQLLQFGAGGHNDTWSCPGYYRSIANFIHDCRLRCQRGGQHPPIPLEGPVKAPPMHSTGDGTLLVVQSGGDAANCSPPLRHVASLPLTHSSSAPPTSALGPLRPPGPGPPSPRDTSGNASSTSSSPLLLSKTC